MSQSTLVNDIFSDVDQPNQSVFETELLEQVDEQKPQESGNPLEQTVVSDDMKTQDQDQQPIVTQVAVQEPPKGFCSTFGYIFLIVGAFIIFEAAALALSILGFIHITDFKIVDQGSYVYGILLYVFAILAPLTILFFFFSSWFKHYGGCVVYPILSLIIVTAAAIFAVCVLGFLYNQRFPTSWDRVDPNARRQYEKNSKCCLVNYDLSAKNQTMIFMNCPLLTEKQRTINLADDINCAGGKSGICCNSLDIVGDIPLCKNKIKSVKPPMTALCIVEMVMALCMFAVAVFQIYTRVAESLSQPKRFTIQTELI